MSEIVLYVFSGLFFFFRIVYWCVIVDVVLSWLPLLGIQIVIGPLQAITQPLYESIRKIIPTSIGVIDIAPLILILLIDVIVQLILPLIQWFLS